MWCLPKHLAEKLLAKIADGTISPDTMLAMTSAQRRGFFGTFLPEDASQRVNALLESKLILKNQQEGMVTWAKKVAGMTPEAERTLLARVNKMTEVLTPETEDAFLEDLAAHALGTAVTMEEAGNVASLAQEVQTRKEAMEAGPRRGQDGKPTETELDYGRALDAFHTYVSTVKAAADHENVGEWASRKLGEYIENPFRVLGDSLGFVASTSKGIRGSIDNSFLGRQGRNMAWKGMSEILTPWRGNFESGKAWFDTFKQSYNILWESLKGNGPALMAEVRAEILSDPEYDLIRKAKVDTSVIEEEVPTDLPTRIPIVGRVFEASNNAFTGSAHLLRYRTAKMYLRIARLSGLDLTDRAQLEGIGRLVNSLTGRGEVKGGSDPGLVDNVFWSRRMMKADFDNLTAHLFNRSETAFVRKQALWNLLRIIIAQGLVLAIADLIDDDSVTWDPRASDAFKIKVGNTRFDIGGGMGAMVRLAARIAPLLAGKDAYMITSSGNKVKINTGEFGKTTGLILTQDFLGNKAAPLTSVVMSRLAGKYRFTDEKPTFIGDLRELYVPMPIMTAKELINDEESANFLLTMMIDAQGISSQTYDQKKTKGASK